MAKKSKSHRTNFKGLEPLRQLFSGQLSLEEYRKVAGPLFEVTELTELPEGKPAPCKTPAKARPVGKKDPTSFIPPKSASLSFQEFLEKTYTLLQGKNFWSVTESYLDPATHQKIIDSGHTRTQRLQEYTFVVSWNLQESPDPGTPPEFDLILEIFAPQISILQYQSIYRQVMEQGEDSYTDWYATHATHEGYRGFNVEKLYEALEERDII